MQRNIENGGNEGEIIIGLTKLPGEFGEGLTAFRQEIHRGRASFEKADPNGGARERNFYRLQFLRPASANCLLGRLFDRIER